MPIPKMAIIQQLLGQQQPQMQATQIANRFPEQTIHPLTIQQFLSRGDVQGLINHAEGDDDLRAIKQAMDQQGLYTGFPALQIGGK